MVQVDGRHHDMTRFLSLQLDDAFTEVGLYYLNATSLQIRVHLALLGQHRLGFYHLLDIVLFQDAIDNLIKLIGIFGPMDDTAVFLCICRELIEIFVKVGDGMALDGAGLFA